MYRTDTQSPPRAFEGRPEAGGFNLGASHAEAMNGCAVLSYVTTSANALDDAFPLADKFTVPPPAASRGHDYSTI